MKSTTIAAISAMKHELDHEQEPVGQQVPLAHRREPARCGCEDDELPRDPQAEESAEARQIRGCEIRVDPVLGRASNEVGNGAEREGERRDERDPGGNRGRNHGWIVAGY